MRRLSIEAVPVAELGSPDLRHLGAPLADDAANELVGDGHLVSLLLGSLAPRLPG